MLENFRAQKIVWDWANNQIYDLVEASGGDTNGRKLDVTILNRSTVENLTGGVLSLAWHYGEHQGLDAFTEIDATKGKFEIYYTTGMLSNHGTLTASLVLVDVKGRIESKPFDIVVRPGIVDDEAVQSENSFTALTEALVKVSQVQAEFDGLYADKSLMMDTLKVEKSNEMDQLYDDKNQALTGLESDFADKAENLETTYAPRLTSAEQDITTNHQEVTAQLAQKITRGEVGVSDIDKNKGKLDQTYMTDEFLQQVAGSTSINAVPADDSITLNKLTFYKESTNKYNEATARVNTYLFRANGNEVASEGFTASGFIRVNPETDYIIRVVRHIVYYDSDKNYISADPDVNTRYRHVVTTPENARFMRISWGNSDSSANQQVNEGSQELTYEPYYIYIDKNYVEKHPFEPEDIPDNSIGVKKASFIKQGKNLFNKNDVETGRYINHNNGQTLSNSSYSASTFIEVDSSTDYTFNRHRHSAFYDEGQAYISGNNTETDNGLTLTTPENAKYVRFSVLNSHLNLLQLEKGATVTTYEPYSFFLDGVKTSDSTPPKTETLNDSDYYGKFNLKNWQTVASQFESDTSIQRLELAILGDSWVRTSARVTKPLRDKLKSKYGNGGIGFVGFSEIRLASAETQIATTGSWETINGEKGLDRRQYQSVEVGSTIKLTTYEESKRVEIHHVQQTGTYRYRVNNGDWITVDTSVDTFTSTESFIPGNVVLDIEVLSGTVTLLNAYLFNEERGAVVHQWGYGGAKADSFTSVERSHFVSELQKTNIQTVGILLGTNDMAQNVPIDDFKKHIKEIISRIKEAKPLSDVFLISPTENNLSSRLHTMEEYDNALYEVAKEEDVGYVSLYKNFGTYDESNERGLFEDDVHPNASGGRIIGNIIYDRLLRMS